MAIQRIVSAGQQGAALGGLEAAVLCGLEHGGWRARRPGGAGAAPSFGLLELNTPERAVEAEANVVDSDATLVFNFGPRINGLHRTLRLCSDYRKPWLYLDLYFVSRARAVDAAVRWLAGHPLFNAYEQYEAVPHRRCVLHVAGPHESEAAGIQEAVTGILVDVLQEVNGGYRETWIDPPARPCEQNRD
jgi:hypothetical protein